MFFKYWRICSLLVDQYGCITDNWREPTSWRKTLQSPSSKCVRYIRYVLLSGSLSFHKCIVTRADILLHADVALADVKGALLFMWDYQRIILGRRLSFSFRLLKKKIMLAGIFSVCNVSIGWVNWSQWQYIVLKMMQKSKKIDLNVGILCVVRDCVDWVSFASLDGMNWTKITGFDLV